LEADHPAAHPQPRRTAGLRADLAPQRHRALARGKEGGMKVRVSYTVDVSDKYRRAINLHYGKPGLATREGVRRWLEGHGSAEDADLIWDYEQAVDCGDEPDRPD